VRCFVHIYTGAERIEAISASEFPDLSTAKHAATEKARDLLLTRLSPSRLIFPEFFIEISGESGKLFALLPLRKVLFGEAISDRHRGLLEAVPYPWLQLNTNLTIQDANAGYYRATFTEHDLIAGLNMFDAFPDNPGDLQANGVKNLSASLHEVPRTREPHTMARQRYDIRLRSGPWRMRHWQPINVPVLDHNGEVVAIIHHVEDVTGPTLKGRTFAAGTPKMT
jgi:PAS domain-containing protein